MCLPKPPKPVAPAPTAFPSIAAASALELGGQDPLKNPRGAAQLGRLLLRFNPNAPVGQPSQQAPSQAPDGSTPQATPTSTPNLPYSGGFGSSFAFRGFDNTAEL